MLEHPWKDCPNTQSIGNLERWQEAQNGHLSDMSKALGALEQAEARRAGLESFIKWILGFAAVSGATGITSLVLKLFEGG